MKPLAAIVLLTLIPSLGQGAVARLKGGDEPEAPLTDAKLDGPAGTTNTKAAEYRFEWNKSTLVDDYEKVGHKNKAWDKEAKAALLAFAQARCRRGDTATVATDMERSVKAAVSAGCDDPLIKYLHLRYTVGLPMKVNADGAKAYVESARELVQSRYSSIRKLYASLRAAEALKSANKGRTNTPPEIHFHRRSALSHLQQVLGDKRTPIQEVYEACTELLDAVKVNRQQFEEYYFLLEKPLFANWSNEALAHLVKGDFYISYAWKARGTGYAYTVTEEAAKLFEARLALAEKALEKAWSIDPTIDTIPLRMMTVELGQGKGRERMELWFKRVMQLNPNCYQACSHKLYYLEPKWYGTKASLGAKQSMRIC
jgi:tetratricopeptide (TPR) repeat protein